jgi:predicted RNase H-like nuclease (RuvC/YqgF family)
MLASVTAFALPVEDKKTNKPATAGAAVVAETNPMISVSQLQQENTLLKTQLMALINENEELQSRLAFETTMRNMFTSLEVKKNQEKLEDLQATMQYNQLMSNMLLTLRRK